MNSPGKTLAGASSQPRQEPYRGNLPNINEAATLELGSPDTIDNIRTKAREAPPWWHADLCEDQKYTRTNKNEKMKATSKALAGDDNTPR